MKEFFIEINNDGCGFIIYCGSMRNRIVKGQFVFNGRGAYELLFKSQEAENKLLNDKEFCEYINSVFELLSDYRKKALEIIKERMDLEYELDNRKNKP